MLSCLQRREHVLVVEMGRGEDLDGVDVRVLEHAIQVGVDLGCAPAVGRRPRGGLVDVTDCDDVAERVLEVSGDVHVGDVPRAHDPEADALERCDHRSLPSRTTAAHLRVQRLREPPLPRLRKPTRPRSRRSGHSSCLNEASDSSVAGRHLCSSSEADKAFHVEQHGIDYIPDSERWAKPRDLFGMWAGASVQIEYFVYGAILMTFGFTFAQAVVLIVLGNLSFLLLGLCSLQGPDAGTTVFAISRAPYGTNGSRLIAFFNWLTQIGFETEGLILIVGADPGPRRQGRLRPRHPLQGRRHPRCGRDAGGASFPRPRHDGQGPALPDPAVRCPLRDPRGDRRRAHSS